MNSSLRVGQSFGPYQIQSLLGEGGMAVVYRARHRLLGTEHAIKMLKTTTADAERLLREGRVQSQIQHPNIVAVTDLVPQLGQLALVMEYVDGPSLETVLQHRKLTVAQINQVAREILAGVSAVHAEGLVHRDLKPGNVLLALTPDGPVAKVADFGLVKGEDSLLQTATGTVMGTPAYMAPEQFLDAAQVDARADVFSLGAMLYHMVTAVRPFRAPSVLGVIDAIRMGRFVPVRERQPDCPAGLATLIESALKPDRDARPASATEMLARWCEAFPDDTPARWPNDELAAYAAAALPVPAAQNEATLTAPGRLGRQPVPTSQLEPAPQSISPVVTDASAGGTLSVGFVLTAVLSVVLLATAILWWTSRADEAPVKTPAPTSASAKPCSQSKYGGTLRMRSNRGQGRLTVYGGGSREAYAMRWVYETLMTEEGDTSLELVDLRLSADQRTAWVTLHEGIRFHPHPAFAEANPLGDAHDVAWSIINRFKRTGNDGGLLGLADWEPSPDTWPEGVEIVSPRVVKLRFARTVPRLRSELALTWFMSHDLMMSENPLGFVHPAGTGPFRWVSDNTALARVERFDQYWRTTKTGERLPYLDAIELHQPGDLLHAIARLNDGELDLVQLRRWERKHAFEPKTHVLNAPLRHPQTRVLKGANGLVTIAALNLWGHLGPRTFDGTDPARRAKVKAALSQPDVRLALGLAIDRDAIARALGRPYRSTTSFLPPRWLGAPAVQTTAAQPERAQQMLQAAGVTDLELTLLGGMSARVERQIQADWAKIGVRVSFASADGQGVRMRLADGALGGLGSGPILPADPYQHMRNMAMHVVQLVDEDLDIAEKLNALALAGTRSEQTAQAAGELDRAIRAHGITQPLASHSGHRDARLWIARQDLCNVAHPVSGQISHFRPTQWYLDRQP